MTDRIRRAALQVLGGLLLATAGLLAWWSAEDREREDQKSVSGAEATEQNRPRLSDRTTSGLLMSEREWDVEFARDYPHVSQEKRDDVVALSHELQSALENGLDPRSPEVRVYAETIRTLLLASETEAR